MKHPGLLKTLCTLICVTAAGASSASNYGTISISNFSYALTDLNANDGVTSSFTLTPTRFLSRTTITAEMGNEDDPGYSWKSTDTNGQNSLGATSASQSNSQHSGSAAISGTGTLETLGLTASSEAYYASSSIHTGSSAQVNATKFLLSANTGLQISYTVSGTVHIDPLREGWTGVGASSYAGVTLIQGFSIFQESSYADTTLASTTDPYTYTWSKTTIISYDNLSNSTVNGSLFVDAITSAYISAVPEPSGYAMLGAGLAMLGAVTSRRRKKT